MHGTIVPVLVTLAVVGILGAVFARWGLFWLRRAGYHMVRWGQEQHTGTLPKRVGSRATEVIADMERDERREVRRVQIQALATAHDAGDYVILGRHPVGHLVLYASGDQAHMKKLCALKNEDAADGHTGWTYTVEPHHAPGTPWRPPGYVEPVYPVDVDTSEDQR